MNYRELTRKLRKLDCVFDRYAKGSHEIWMHSKTGLRTTVPNWGSKDLSKGTISRMLRDLGLRKDDFDKA
ncbi:MAG: type II toxin-antitoxin system HicA family toxin [Chloroflexota bacterium]